MDPTVDIAGIEAEPFVNDAVVMESGPQLALISDATTGVGSPPTFVAPSFFGMVQNGGQSWDRFRIVVQSKIEMVNPGGHLKLRRIGGDGRSRRSKNSKQIQFEKACHAEGRRQKAHRWLAVDVTLVFIQRAYPMLGMTIHLAQFDVNHCRDHDRRIGYDYSSSILLIDLFSKIELHNCVNCF